MTRPRFEPEHEVRFAVVMYGGVSLAIYINGVARELFNLVKATAPEISPTVQPADQDVYFHDEGSRDADESVCLSGSESVYRELGQWLGAAGPEQPHPRAGHPPPVRTRFVVDIISGTSAGGINGIFLGKAIAQQQDFGVSSKLWLDVADIAKLFRGEDSWEGMPAAGRRDPESLLNGTRLYWEALRAMREMAAGRRTQVPDDAFRPSYADQLDLAVTATDLAGLPLPVRLSAERSVRELVHRKVFGFAYGTAQAIGEERTDFSDTDDPMLAFSARATSSFPFAFEPVKVEDIDPVARAEGYPDPDVSRFLEEYDDPRRVFFADGGYLDAKPFTYATAALRRRRADVPVSRKLVYIEPDPAADDAEPPRLEERPTVYQNVMDAMLRLPRYETIRQDIADVAERNRLVARLRDIELDAEEAIHAAREDGALSEALRGPAHAAYVSLRTRIVRDQLVGLAAAIRGWALDDEPAIRLADALREWARADAARLNLAALDSAFQWRRQSFLHDRIGDLLRGGARAGDMARLARGQGLTVPDPAGGGEATTALRGLKYQLNEAFDGLRRAERAFFARDPAAALTDDVQLDRFTQVEAEAARLPDDGIDGFVAAVETYLADPLEQAAGGIRAALTGAELPEWMSRLLDSYDQRFELFDLIVLPLAYPSLGETNAVEIRRISPRDAPNTTPDALREDPTRKLAGVRVRHFGAFLDRYWRENDLMWGRLDAAEAILDAVMPGAEHEQLRARLRVRAQAAILRESLTGPLRRRLRPLLVQQPSEAGDRDLVTAFREAYEEAPQLPDERELELVGTGLGVTGEVLAVNPPSGLLRAPLRGLALAGRAVAAGARLRDRIRWWRR